jgi:quinol monooxygenase YgiN
MVYAPEVQPAERVEPGCLAYDFFACTDDPDRLVFVEAWQDKAAQKFHMAQEHTRCFIAFHEPKHVSMTFETINPAD